MPHTNFPEKIRLRSIWAMDVPIISKAAGTVMFPSRVIGVVIRFGSPLMSNTTIRVDFPERECQKGERDVQQARIEDGVFAENRGDYRVADEADIAESQHESVDALHVLVFRDDA